MNQKKFKKIIWGYYRESGRHDLPWRKTRDPYKILVSEVMLQQTQVSRVLVKYKSFLEKFPTAQALAQASLRDVLLEWQGLGYNRRGMYLKQCAEKIVADFDGKFPRDMKALISLPGIGPATAGDILAFAWNIPIVVIETNIRAVFIHFYFTDQVKVSDKEILPLIKKTLPKNPIRTNGFQKKPTSNGTGPREWYWALFDYGAYLKSTKIKNPNHKSKHHTKQSKFVGSNRQKRAEILRLILEKPQTEKKIVKLTKYEQSLVVEILNGLEIEGMVSKVKNRFCVN